VKNAPVAEPFPYEDFQQALGTLKTALVRGPAYALLLGDSGSGKTTLLRALAAKLDRRRFQVLYLCHGRPSPSGLARVLADSTVLYAKTHGFHWNVTGPMFNTLHLMFMDQYTELWTALDLIAERIRALGFPAPFGGSLYAGLSSIPEAEGVPAALAMVKELVEGHEAVARTIRSVFTTADEASDQPTADLLTQRLQIHEKTAWMLRSLLEG